MLGPDLIFCGQDVEPNLRLNSCKGLHSAPALSANIRLGWKGQSLKLSRFRTKFSATNFKDETFYRVIVANNYDDLSSFNDCKEGYNATCQEPHLRHARAFGDYQYYLSFGGDQVSTF
jgi:hypothetical protein